MTRRLWLPLGALLLAGCATINVDTAPIASALPGLTAQLAAGQALAGQQGGAAPSSAPTYGPPVPGAGYCANGATPADGTLLGTLEMGAYAGTVLPSSFAVYQSEQDITSRITQFSQDTSPDGATTWANFRCLFSQAVAVWASRFQMPVVPSPTPTPTPTPQATSADVPAGCPADINPANGTISGTAAMGDYNGALLPGSFGVYLSEQDVTDRIGAFAADTSDAGVSTWAAFQCFYSQAVSVWRSKQAAGGDPSAGGDV